MEDEVVDSVPDETYSEASPPQHANGSAKGAELRDLLGILGAMRGGDFSVRLPSDWDGLWGKVADTFNDIVASNERMAQQLDRVGQVVGREGKTKQRVRIGSAAGAWGEMETSINSADRRPAVADHGSDAHDSRRRPGRPSANHAPRRRRTSAGGRVPALGDHRQHDDQAALGVHLGGDARRARGRHRRQARRPGAGLAR